MNKHEYICAITEIAAMKSTCDRAAVGAVIVNQEYEVITTGYNGSPKGMPDCGQIGHMMENGHCIRTVHAEQNAIIQAAKHGVSVKGCILYTTHSPCIVCAKMIINAGIDQVRYRDRYDFRGLELLENAGVELGKWTE